MKKYEFVFDAPKECVIDKLLDGVIKTGFSENVKLFEQDAIYGKLSKDKVFLYHGTPFRNSCRPIFSAKIIEEEKTVIRGFWRLPVSVNIFFSVWYLLLMYMAIFPLIADGEGNWPLFYCWIFFLAIFGVFTIAFGSLIERKRMKKVIEYIENLQESLNKSV